MENAKVNLLGTTFYERFDAFNHLGEIVFFLKQHMVWAVQLNEGRIRDAGGEEFTFRNWRDGIAIAVKDKGWDLHLW